MDKILFQSREQNPKRAGKMAALTLNPDSRPRRI
jgi:hypothetical protein